MTTSLSKKRGRPLGTKNIKKENPPEVLPLLGEKRLNAKPSALKWKYSQAMESRLKHVENLELTIDNLNYKISQYKVVIDYLETKLGLPK